MYFEELKQGSNKEIGPKDIFEKASSLNSGFNCTPSGKPRAGGTGVTMIGGRNRTPGFRWPG